MTHKKWREYYRSYKESGLFDFLRSNILKLVLTLLIFVSVLYVFQAVFPQFVSKLDLHLSKQKPSLIFLIFFISESFLGILPPDLFILWTKKLNDVWLGITLLAFLSYLGGIISYWIGLRISHWKKVESFLEHQLVKHLGLIKEWGGLVIVIAALFPLPFSPISIAAGSLRFPKKRFLIYASFRILRFYFYATMLFQLF